VIFEEPEFNESEERSLEIFNNICGNLRGDYSHDCIGLMKIWEVTLYIFSNEFNETLLKKLLSTLMKRRPLIKEIIIYTNEKKTALEK